MAFGGCCSGRGRRNCGSRFELRSGGDLADLTRQAKGDEVPKSQARLLRDRLQSFEGLGWKIQGHLAITPFPEEFAVAGNSLTS